MMFLVLESMISQMVGQLCPGDVCGNSYAGPCLDLGMHMHFKRGIFFLHFAPIKGYQFFAITAHVPLGTMGHIPLLEL